MAPNTFLTAGFIAMALKRLFSISALVAVCLTTNLAMSQLHVPGPRFEHRAVESADSTRPVASPGIYDYDFQIFSPVEFSNNDELGPNTGFFFTFDKIYTSVSGGDEFGGINNDFIWGNRYDFGYMNDDDDGWNIVYEQSEGNQFINGRDILASNPMLFNTKLASVEVNKVFRQQLKHGGWVEPYIGLRYYNVSDSTIQDSPLGLLGFENRFKQNVTNDAVGLNLGGRVVKRRGRWRYSNDLSLSTNYNQQDFIASDLTTSAGVLVVDERRDSDSSFVPAIDYRFELAYNLSRDFAIRGGGTVQYLWDGIARANNNTTIENPNSIFGFDPTLGGDATITGGGIVDDRLLVAGFSFGFEYRR